MANLKRSEMRFIDEVFGRGSGYVLDFSNRTFAEFFEDEFSINIYREKYETPTGGAQFGSLVALFWGSEKDGPRLILRLTKSANPAVINSTIAQPRNCEGVSCWKAEASALALPLPSWGFCCSLHFFGLIFFDVDQRHRLRSCD
jgi:hypothetical protein